MWECVWACLFGWQNDLCGHGTFAAETQRNRFSLRLCGECVPHAFSHNCWWIRVFLRNCCNSFVQKTPASSNSPVIRPFHGPPTLWRRSCYVQRVFGASTWTR